MGEAKRRKSQPAWRTQIVLCYEEEPYAAFDATPALLEQAIATENPPTDNNDVAHDWVISTLTKLREDVALIRDHSDELMFDTERQAQLANRAILLVQYYLVVKKERLGSVAAVMFNLLARQSASNANAPAFQLAALNAPLSVDEIRALSTARYLYQQTDDGLRQIPMPQPTKDRSKDRECVSIQAFWRNERPGGLAIGMEANVAEGQTNLNVEMEALDSLVMTLVKDQPSAKDVEEFLRHQAQQSKRDPGTNLMIIAAIAYAEEAGFLQSDEFNGMLYIYRLDDNDFFVDRKDQPQKPVT